MSIGKEWEIATTVAITKLLSGELFFRRSSTTNAYIEKSLNARNGTFSQVRSHIMLKFIFCQNFTFTT